MIENILFFLILIGSFLFISYLYVSSHPYSNYINNFANVLANTFSNEGFGSNLLDLNSSQRCNLLGNKKFMIRDLRTKLWLISGQEEGFSKFLPGRFGNTFMMSSTPDQYLPLRTISVPNDYLLATFDGKGIRSVSNPYNKYYVIEVFIWNGSNILGWLDESGKQLYMYVNDNGNINSVENPENASKIEIIEV